jgi:chloramphenicol O-acetyltransferase type A
MAFRIIDLATYPRREHYERFLEMKLTYSATVQIDITRVRALARERGYRMYPAQIWMLTTVANRVPEFRMSHDGEGKLGVWDELSAHYTVIDPETHVFSSLWTPQCETFADYHEAYRRDVEQLLKSGRAPDGSPPGNLL